MVGICNVHPDLDARVIRNPSTGEVEGPFPPSNAAKDKDTKATYTYASSEV
jgi:hypothetical protein